MTASKTFNVAIVGGGVAGLTLAIALHHRQIPVTVYEQAAQFGEIGAGVSFSPNAVQAMKYCHPGIYTAFEKVCTRNVWPSKQKVWFDYVDGYNFKGDCQSIPTAFTICNRLGQNGVHRAHFLDELVKMFPQSIARFGKRIQNITEDSNGRLVLSFTDGTTAESDVVIGCDGIKSRVRQIIVGETHPSANPVYSHKYAYRGLVSMEVAIAAIGEERAQNSCMHVSNPPPRGSFRRLSTDFDKMGPGGHILTFPVNQGKTLNIVAFRSTTEDWPDSQKLTRMGTQEDALRDFAGYGSIVLSLLKLTAPELPVVSIPFRLLGEKTMRDK
jgi:salicylate hydroxylase